jgi:hypothetical protein
MEIVAETIPQLMTSNYIVHKTMSSWKMNSLGQQRLGPGFTTGSVYFVEQIFSSFFQGQTLGKENNVSPDSQLGFGLFVLTWEGSCGSNCT